LKPTAWDHSSHAEFVEYYAEKSAQPELIRHFRSIQKTILSRIGQRSGKSEKFDVLDVGCNAGTQCLVWTELGHRVHGLDVNEPLLKLAGRRAAAAGYRVDFRLGSAVDLPWPDNSMDVCIALELLEHVVDWQRCLDEFTRVLRPGGVLYFSTTNRLCPKQQEFNLFAYSWYPAPLKRHFERLASTTRPAVANYAMYPAVNWFTPYELHRELARRGFASFDRFDLIDTSEKGKAARFVVASIRAVPALRLLANFCHSSSMLLGMKG
jgi:ubiquinone/menaquinone biosynthesis C-methylase UbiE